MLELYKMCYGRTGEGYKANSWAIMVHLRLLMPVHKSPNANITSAKSTGGSTMPCKDCMWWQNRNMYGLQFTNSTQLCFVPQLLEGSTNLFTTMWMINWFELNLAQMNHIEMMRANYRIEKQWYSSYKTVTAIVRWVWVYWYLPLGYVSTWLQQKPLF